MKATIQERGNGFCAPGDYVTADGDLYRVVSMSGPIHTGQSGSGTPNYIYGEIEPADWSDITDAEADDIICTAIIDDEEED